MKELPIDAKARRKLWAKHRKHLAVREGAEQRVMGKLEKAAVLLEETNGHFLEARPPGAASAVDVMPLIKVRSAVVRLAAHYQVKAAALCFDDDAGGDRVPEAAEAVSLLWWLQHDCQQLQLAAEVVRGEPNDSTWWANHDQFRMAQSWVFSTVALGRQQAGIAPLLFAKQRRYQTAGKLPDLMLDHALFELGVWAWIGPDEAESPRGQLLTQVLKSWDDQAAFEAVLCEVLDLHLLCQDGHPAFAAYSAQEELKLSVASGNFAGLWLEHEPLAVEALCLARLRVEQGYPWPSLDHPLWPDGLEMIYRLAAERSGRPASPALSTLDTAMAMLPVQARLEAHLA